MAVYKIFKGTEQINRIVANEEFVKEYYSHDSYSYELEPETTPQPSYTETQRLAQQITDEELARIEMGQSMTDLELYMLGGV